MSFFRWGLVGHVSKTDVNGGGQARTVAELPQFQVVLPSGGSVAAAWGVCSRYISPAIFSAIAFRWRHCALVITLFS